MFFTNLFKIKKACMHEKITPDMESGYCPDCGKLIQNDWYITRCGCCGVKLRTMSHRGEIMPQDHYCRNCGSDEYIVEKLPKINFIDINFAVLIKTEVETLKNIPKTTSFSEERKPLLLRLPIKSL